MAALCRISEPRIAPWQERAWWLEAPKIDISMRTLHFMPGPWYKPLKCSITKKKKQIIKIRAAEIDSNIALAIIPGIIAGWDAPQALEQLGYMLGCWSCFSQ